MNEYRNLRVALLGAGSVGSQVAKLLLEQDDELATRVGAKLELVGVAVRSLESKRDYEIPAELLTQDTETLIHGADLVIELIGGIEPAKTLVLQAINSGADVITGNKALIAAHGPELQAAAAQVGAQLYYEAAVGGAIPIIRPLRENLAGDNINRVMGIVNGTTNYILDKMNTEGLDFAEALAGATAAGYAEADPTADVEGLDAANKCAILASLAFHTHVPLDSVYCEGITKITKNDIANAKKSGYVLKLLAIAERKNRADGSEAVSAKVHPALLPIRHPLATVHGANNAVFVEAQSAGNLMFYGAGAGGVQTASAVLGDLVTAARRLVVGSYGTTQQAREGIALMPFAETTTRYQVSLTVIDAPGVLAKVASIFSSHGVSVETVLQSSAKGGQAATLTIGTHLASEASLAATVQALAESSEVTNVDSILRVEGL